MPKKYVVETDKGKFIVEVDDSPSDAKPIDPNETDNPLVAGVKSFGKYLKDEFTGAMARTAPTKEDPFTVHGASPKIEKFMQTPLVHPTGVDAIDSLSSPFALSTLGMTVAKPALEAPLNRGSVVKGLRAVAEPTSMWRRGVNAAADALERGGQTKEPTRVISDVVKPVKGATPYSMGPPEKTMADVYSEKPAPAPDPNVRTPFEPTKISDVVRPVEGATPYDMPQEPEGRISDVVHDVPGAEPYDMSEPAGKTMADVYSEKPAPPKPEAPAPTGPNKMSPRVVGKAPSLEDVLTDIVSGVPGSDPASASTASELPDVKGSQKPRLGKRPGGYTTDNPPKPAYDAPGQDLPAEGVERSPSDTRKASRFSEEDLGGDELGQWLDAVHGTTEADPVPSINPEGNGPASSFADTMKSTEPEFDRNVHTGAERQSPAAKSAAAHHKMYGEMDADYRRRLDDPLGALLVTLLGGGGAASAISKEPE